MIAVDCPRPWEDEELLTVGTFQFNTTASFSCVSGHRLIGPTELFCQLNGQWNAPVPTCVPVSCPLLNVTDPRLYIEANGTAYDDLAVFSCAAGFSLKGP